MQRYYSLMSDFDGNYIKQIPVNKKESHLTR